MVANMGCANVFAQIGMFDANNGNNGNLQQHFDAISTSSGSTWFGLQFFYLQSFFDAVVGKPGTGTAVVPSPQSLGSYVETWMKAYGQMQVDAAQQAAAGGGGADTLQQCQEVLSPLAELPAAFSSEVASLCAFMAQFQFDWANFVQDMLVWTTNGGGPAQNSSSSTDATAGREFVSTQATPDNVVSAALRNVTTLHVQTTLLPNLRGWGAYTYLGPDIQENDDVYTVPLAMQWSVFGGSWYSATPGRNRFPGGLTYNFTTANNTLSAAVQGFPMYPPSADGKDDLTTSVDGDPVASVMEVPEPFGGLSPTVAQLAAASSGKYL